MEDLLYFTRSSVSLDDIGALAERTGYRAVLTEGGGGRALAVYFGGRVESWQRESAGASLEPYLRDDRWLWHEWGDRDSLEPADRRILDEYGPVSSFLVSYHVGSLPALRSFLKVALQRYGGWVGAADWSRPYDVENIETLEHE